MEILIKTTEPPKSIYTKCQKKFGKDIVDMDKGVVFTYGNTIYTKNKLPYAILKHEEVHVKQQTEMGKTKWWNKYLEDDQFRFSQELEAHQAEYKAYCEETKDRNKQAIYKQHIALRLSSPLYGKLITTQEALKLIC